MTTYMENLTSPFAFHENSVNDNSPNIAALKQHSMTSYHRFYNEIVNLPESRLPQNIDDADYVYNQDDLPEQMEYLMRMNKEARGRYWAEEFERNGVRYAAFMSMPVFKHINIERTFRMRRPGENLCRMGNVVQIAEKVMEEMGVTGISAACTAFLLGV